MKKMKKLTKIFAVAILGIAAACSQKELAPAVENNEGVVPVYENLGAVNFTAEITATKGYDATGKVSWEVGDYIIVAPQRRIISGTPEENVQWYPANDTKVILTSEMISADGKTATFSIDGLPTDVPGYYAMYSPTLHGSSAWVDGSNCWEKDFCWIAGMHTGGYVNLNTFTEYGAKCKPDLAYASCTTMDTKLTFKNVGTIIKWDTRVNNIQHVDFVDNSGADVHMLAFTSSVNGNPGTNDSVKAKTLKCYTGATNSGAALGGPYYIFLCPQTFSDGFSLYFYSGWSGYQNGAVPVGKIVYDQEFVAKAGDFWDMGYVEDHYAYDTYKEAYDAGQDIKVGDLVVNKATYGASQLLTSDARFYPASGVAFVDPSASGANLQYWSGSKCIVIGNDPSQRSSLEIRATGNFGDGCTVAFKNLKIKLQDGFTNAWMARTNNGETLNWFAIDNCEVWFYTRLVELFNSNLNNFSVTNSDIVVRNDCGPYDLHRSLICRGPETAYTAQKLIFKNNLVTTEGTDVKSFGLINNDATKLTVNTVDISQNTIHNIQNASFYFVCLSNIGTSITMTKNLLWKGGNFNWIQLYGLADGASAAFDFSGVTGNKLEGWVLRAANGDAVVATGTAGYYAASSEYPFAQGDNATVISTRDYTVIPALAGYGVTNPKRLQ